MCAAAFPFVYIFFALSRGGWKREKRDENGSEKVAARKNTVAVAY